MKKFSDIPQFTSDGNYEVFIPLVDLEDNLKHYDEAYELELNPDFQRGHVWTTEQQIAWLEFFFRGGKTSRTIYFNCADFSHGHIRNEKQRDIEGMVCVDGLQRLTAIRAFLNNDVPIFGTYYKDFEDKLSWSEHGIYFNINNLQTRREVLTWYIEMNSGGTPHTTEEIERVQKMIEQLEV